MKTFDRLIGQTGKLKNLSLRSQTADALHNKHRRVVGCSLDTIVDLKRKAELGILLAGRKELFCCFVKCVTMCDVCDSVNML